MSGSPRPATTKRNSYRCWSIRRFPSTTTPPSWGRAGGCVSATVSFGPRNAAGAQAWDTFGTLAATTRKLGLSFFADIQDRVGATNQIPRLDQIIQARAQNLNLGMSWTAS